MTDVRFRITKKTVLLSYITQFFQYGVTILILPVILSGISSEELGIWYLFLSVSSLVSLMDFGFSPSIQRNVAYVFSGAKKLVREGLVDESQGFINYHLLKSLIYTSSRIYRKIAIGIFLVSNTLGLLYIYYSVGSKFSMYILYLWILYVFTISQNFYYSYLLAFVRGRGKMSEFNLIVIISKSAFLFSLFILIHLGYGLFSFIVATFVNSIINILLCKRCYLSRFEKLRLQAISEPEVNLFSVIWKNAKNSGIVNLGVVLFSQVGIFLSGLYLSLNEVAQLGLTLQLFAILLVVCRVYLTTCIPQISSMWITSTNNEIKKVFLKAQMIGYTIYVISIIVILTYGNLILEKFVHSNVLLPSSIIIVLYGLFYLMELTHGNCCILISTTNRIPFTKASIIAGIAAIILTMVFIQINLGMIAFPLALVCSSLPYNSWKWPIMAYQMLKN